MFLGREGIDMRKGKGERKGGGGNKSLLTWTGILKGGGNKSLLHWTGISKGRG